MYSTVAPVAGDDIGDSLKKINQAIESHSWVPGGETAVDWSRSDITFADSGVTFATLTY